MSRLPRQTPWAEIFIWPKLHGHLITMGHDRYPQPLILHIDNDPDPNTFNSVSIQTPVVQTGSRTFVMNIQRAEWILEEADNIAATDTSVTAIVFSGVAPVAGLPSESPQIITQRNNNIQIGATSIIYERVKMFDYTDGAGNGQLYASSVISIGLSGNNNIETKFATCKLWYVLVSVSAAELVGILRAGA